MTKYQDIDFTDCDVLLAEELPKDCVEDVGFVYYCKDYKQVIDLAVSNEVNLANATRKWCNYIWKKVIEEILVENGADFVCQEPTCTGGVYINDRRYIVEIIETNSDINASTRAEKNWLLGTTLYPINNTLYFLIDKETYNQANWVKPNASNLRNAIKSFMKYYNNHEPNSVMIDDNKIFSDIILIKSDKMVDES